MGQTVPSKPIDKKVELFDGEMLYAKSGQVERWIDTKYKIVCYKHGDIELGCVEISKVKLK